MKTIRLFAIAAVMCTIVSCSDDDNDVRNNNGVVPEYAGTYLLTLVTAPEFVDFNGDGTASSDMTQESPCYAGSKIILHADGSYELVNNTVLHESETGCFYETVTGIWEMDGSDILLTNTTYDVPLTTEHDFTGDQIIIEYGNGQYPKRDEMNNPVYGTGVVTYFYTKEL